ncbi:hypothetical protein [Hyphomonas sp.]|uniref:hypothetical protein n=1 Tax=Hyphomonas sp. TaxID=87 RepID=UPI000C8FE82A|nr:hypothetical protein [Hyphomonas sp.]MAL45874.1 hypothetical protein [Hyphomonas sp.]|tara:strand:- start:140 stop:667 length:528 start_codon:yes stop_codon:yes gene_type:complete
MKKLVVSEISIIYGTVDSPKGFEIDRKKIKNDIINSSVTNQKFNNSDYKVPFSQPLQWFQDYIRDFFKSEHNQTLIPKLNFAYLLNEGQTSINRNTVDLVDLKNSPDYTLLYGVDIEDKIDVTIEYNDNRRANRSWTIPLQNNKFIIFPSMQRFFISENKSKKIQTILLTTYEYI